VSALNEYLKSKSLSTREMEVVFLINTGIKNAQAADRLFVTEKTVKYHLTNIYKKLQIKSRTELIVMCNKLVVDHLE
jgi:DNA-binding NarL/FixJ family response regulator